MHLHNDPNVSHQGHRFLDVGRHALLVDGQGVKVEDDGLEAADLAVRDVRMADVLLEGFPLLLRPQQANQNVGRQVQVMSNKIEK